MMSMNSNAITRLYAYAFRSASLSIPGRQSIRKCNVLSSNTDLQIEGEKHIANILENRLNPSTLSVQDISGGCGSMYEILIESENFKGKSIIQQHRMVKEVLAEEIKNMHGLTIKTLVPK